MTWEELKAKGSDHYKTGEVEPIDLYRAGDMLRDFALGNIIKYAYRNRSGMNFFVPVSINDMKKIMHYAEMLIADHESQDPSKHLRPAGFVTHTNI
jgi:hypothetical protein